MTLVAPLRDCLLTCFLLQIMAILLKEESSRHERRHSNTIGSST